MECWALVIGINQYWRDDACLKGAVADALKMREWLLRSNGGAVPHRNLMLLLSPHQGSGVPEGVTALPATQDMIIQAIEQIFKKSGETGDRFYFYFSGHGLTARMDFSNESGIIPCDFTDTLTNKALSLRSIFERFQAAPFQEQFFFIDACRNIPWEGERAFRISHYPLPKFPSPPVPPQFIMYATSPGVKAVEVQEAGSERGAFTDALLAGLGGAGCAKLWNEACGVYEVRWDRLFTYVEQQVIRRRLVVDENRVPPLIQEPRQYGERGNVNPVFASLPGDIFSNEPLDVLLEPPDAAPQTEVSVGDLGGVLLRHFPVSTLPVHFVLPPRTYSIRATATDFNSVRRYYQVDLYGPAKVSVTMVPGKAPLPTQPPAAAPKSIDGDSMTGSLLMQSQDPLSYLELLDNTGNIIASGTGEVYQPGLKPGFYRLRLLTPEGISSERIVEIACGDNARIKLEAPPLTESALFNHIAWSTHMHHGQPSTLHPSEAIGPAESMRLSTILALAGGAANEATSFGGKLRSIGVTSFRESAGTAASSGIQILFGDESSRPETGDTYLSSIRLRCWGIGRDVSNRPRRLESVADLTGLAQATWAVEPGPYVVSLETDERQPVVLSVAVLPNRLTLLVVTRNAAGEENIFQYLPPLAEELPGDPCYENARFPVLRRLEYIQRSFMAGRIDQAYQNARALLSAKWIDPMAGLLGGYLLIRLGKPGELGVPAGNLAEYYGELSDSYVIAAEYEAGMGNDAKAAEAIRRALDRGIPIMSDGLGMLFSGLERFGIEHPRARLVRSFYAGRIRGLLWSACPLRVYEPDQREPTGFGHR